MSDNGTLADELRATVDQYAHRIAVADGTTTLTYGELDIAVQAVASALIDLGVGAGDCVVWHGRKNAAAVAAVHGIGRAGAGFVPVDPDGPIARSDLIVRRARPRTLVVDGATRRQWQSVSPESRWRRLSSSVETIGGLWVSEPDDSAREPMPDLAYVLHTSGSTGQPKGVVHTQASAVAFVDWAVDELGLGPEDVIVNSSPLHFDPSTLHLFGAARVGATVAPVPAVAMTFPRAYLEFCRAVDATVLYAVTSTMTWLARHASDLFGELRSLRAVVFGGEVMHPGDMNILLANAPQARFVNVYGPTESNVCTFYEVRARHVSSDAVIPIGRPVPGTDVLVVDDDLASVAAGRPGQLIVRGPTVMSRYLDDQDATSAFVATADGRLWYPTGDRVAWGTDGEIEFIGRSDTQVKSRGYRIELGEIERHLSAFSGVHECAAIAVPGREFSSSIIAFVSADRSAEAEQLLRLLRARVPNYMVPESLILMTDELPKLSNGKIDRQSLADMAAKEVLEEVKEPESL